MWQNTQRHYSSNLHVWLELTDPLRAHSVQLYSEKPQLPGLSRGTRLLTATIVLSRHEAFPSTKQNAAPFSIRQGLCPFGITNPSPLHLRKGKEVSLPKGLHPFMLLYGQPSISCTQVVKIPPQSREEPRLWIPIWNKCRECHEPWGAGGTWLRYNDNHFYSGGILTLTAIFHLFVFYITQIKSLPLSSSMWPTFWSTTYTANQKHFLQNQKQDKGVLYHHSYSTQCWKTRIKDRRNKRDGSGWKHRYL